MSGTLILAATPIGNLGDITPRLEQAIAAADAVFAEDTRQSQKLLRHLGIKRRLLSFHEFSTESRLERVANLLRDNQTVVYLSDAGSPGISDPGFELVRLAYAIQATVDVLPGPSAVIAALLLSGLPTDRFAFMGFFPRKRKARQTLLEDLSRLHMTTVHFESPQRILNTLDFLSQNIPETPIALCREITKIHQETLRGTPREVRDALKTPKGEMVLVIDVVTQTQETGDPQVVYRQLIESGSSRTHAVKTVSQQFGITKKEVQKRIQRVDLPKPE